MAYIFSYLHHFVISFELKMIIFSTKMHALSLYNLKKFNAFFCPSEALQVLLAFFKSTLLFCLLLTYCCTGLEPVILLLLGEHSTAALNFSAEKIHAGFIRIVCCYSENIWIHCHWLMGVFSLKLKLLIYNIHFTLDASRV
jgi:hypothetical protein